MKRPINRGLLIAICALGCAGDPPGAEVVDAGAADARQDAAAPRGGDALPPGAVALFKTPLCPNGWFPYGPAAGRVLVPTVEGSGVGTTQGKALASGEDRRHGHRLAGRLELRSTSFAGIAGEANHGVAGASALSLMTSADEASAGLPYLQLLVCQKTGLARPGTRPLPPGTLVFFTQAACPAGWAPAAAAAGRFLVGTPEGGTLDATFGGKVAPAARRVHTHRAGGSVSLPAQGIALASGCCASGYAGSGDYTYEATSDEAEAVLPSIQLWPCRKL